jgi:thiazole synthase ThiGH ThiG subunit
MKGGIFNKSDCACSIERFLGEDWIPTMNPTASAPASSATSSVSGLLRPQILINTGIAGAKDPIAMAQAMKHAVIAGRLACKAGRIPRKLYATASSPFDGML